MNEGDFLAEGLPTFTAFKAFPSSVKPPVLPQYKQVAEGLPTLLTHMAYFSSVNILISEGWFFLEGFSASGASEQYLFTVSSQVAEEGRPLKEGLSALAALEALLRVLGRWLVQECGTARDRLPALNAPVLQEVTTNPNSLPTFLSH